MFKARDEKTDELLSAPIWPTWNQTFDNGKTKPMGKKVSSMPFDKDFWSAPQFNADKVTGLNDIKGFITLLPIEWSKNENNNMKFHTGLMVNNESDKKIRPDQNENQTAQNERNLNSTEGNA